MQYGRVYMLHINALIYNEKLITSGAWFTHVISFSLEIKAIHVRINAPSFLWTLSSNARIDKLVQLMLKVEMLNN
jgi:hypothetical protein